MADIEEEQQQEESSSLRTVYPDGGGANTPVSDLRRLSLVYKVKMTQIKMMEDRGYELTDFDKELRAASTTPENFWCFIYPKVCASHQTSSGGAPKSKKGLNTEFWDLLSQTYTLKRNPNIKNQVVFLPPMLERAFPTGRLNMLIKSVKNNPTIRFLDVIYEFQMNKPSRTKLAAINRIVAEWSYSELVIPITQSVYVGFDFTVLTPEKFIEDYGDGDPVAARAGLPAICKDDPLAKYFQWVPDTVFRSVEVGDVNVAVTRLLKDYIVTNNTIAATIDVADQQPKT